MVSQEQIDAARKAADNLVASTPQAPYFKLSFLNTVVQDSLVYVHYERISYPPGEHRIAPATATIIYDTIAGKASWGVDE